jgi:hypothetical protein
MQLDQLTDDVQDLLERVGLQPKRSALVPIALLAAGVLVGGGAALLLAPMTGEKARRRLSHNIAKNMNGTAKTAKKLAKVAAAIV